MIGSRSAAPMAATTPTSAAAFYRDSLADHDYQRAFESAVEKVREQEEREDFDAVGTTDLDRR